MARILRLAPGQRGDGDDPREAASRAQQGGRLYQGAS